jgi:hypothetical protein
VLPEYSVKSRLTGDIDSAIGERWDDLLRMLIPKLRTTRDLDDPVFFELRELIVDELRPASSIAVRILLPAVVTSRFDRKRATGVVYSAAVFFGLFDELDASSPVVG